jgi:DNA (cytosine-5)-methyltransferase 1
MHYGSICSGIEAASVAVAPLGWHPVFFAEIEPFCGAVLQHHYPHVPNVGDFTRIGKETSVGAIDLVIGGTPCQSFSVAGRRAGLADARGNLTLEYFALLDRLRPRWMVWENVPGVLSDDGGRTFGTCLGLLAECGYGFAYRVLNAEHFGVPQRRHRVFLVGYRGDWRPPAAVLFERHSLSGHPAPRRETGQDVAACLTRGADSQGKGGYAGRRREDDGDLIVGAMSSSGATPRKHGHGWGEQDWESGYVVPFDTTQITSKENRCQPQADDPCHPLTGTGHAPAIAAYGGNHTAGSIEVATCCNAHGGTGRLDFESETFILAQNGSDIQVNVLPGALTAGNSRQTSGDLLVTVAPAVAFTERTRKDGRNLELSVETAYALDNPGMGGRSQTRQVLAPCLTQNYGKQPDNSDTGAGPMLIQEGMMVRRLTPRECERLMGLADDYTLVTYRGKPATDGPRYRAIGNSFAVPVVRWIAQRIARVDEMTGREHGALMDQGR